MLTDFVTVTHIGPMAQIENPRWRGRDLENHKKIAITLQERRILGPSIYNVLNG